MPSLSEEVPSPRPDPEQRLETIKKLLSNYKEIRYAVYREPRVDEDQDPEDKFSMVLCILDLDIEYEVIVVDWNDVDEGLPLGTSYGIDPSNGHITDALASRSEFKPGNDGTPVLEIHFMENANNRAGAMRELVRKRRERLDNALKAISEDGVQIGLDVECGISH